MNDIFAILLGLYFIVDFSMREILYLEVRMIIQPYQTNG